MHFFFNVSYVSKKEEILQAELHLFKLRPRPQGTLDPFMRHHGHLVEVISFPSYSGLSQGRVGGAVSLVVEPCPVKVWANAMLTVGSPECLTVRLTVRSQWAHCYHCMVSESVDLTIGYSKLTVSDINSLSTHSKVTVWDHLVSALWGRWVASKWACCEFSCELAVC